MDGLSPPKPKDLRLSLSTWIGICKYKRSSAPKTNSISGTIRSVKSCQPVTVKQVCGCRIGQPNTLCQYAWSIHLPDKHSQPANKTVAKNIPTCIVQAIPPRKAEGWHSILSLIEIQHPKSHWSLFTSKQIPQHGRLKNKSADPTQPNPKCCLPYGTAQRHPWWLGCSCAGHCTERQADTMSCLRGLNL